MMQFDVNAVNHLFESETGPLTIRLMRDLSNLDALHEVYQTVLLNLVMDEQDVYSAIAQTNIYQEKLIKLLHPTDDGVKWMDITDLKWMHDTIDTFEKGWCWSPRFQCQHDKIGQLSALAILNINDHMNDYGFSRFDTCALVELIETWCPKELAPLIHSDLTTRETAGPTEQDVSEQFDRLNELAWLIVSEIV